MEMDEIKVAFLEYGTVMDAANDLEEVSEGETEDVNLVKECLNRELSTN